AAPAARVGVASAVNNAVARTGGLLAVSLLPALAGLTGHDYRNPDAFAAGYRNAMLVNAGMLGLAGFVAAVGIRNQVPQAAPERVVRDLPAGGAHGRVRRRVLAQEGVRVVHVDVEPRTGDAGERREAAVGPADGQVPHLLGAPRADA